MKTLSPFTTSQTSGLRLSCPILHTKARHTPTKAKFLIRKTRSTCFSMTSMMSMTRWDPASLEIPLHTSGTYLLSKSQSRPGCTGVQPRASIITSMLLMAMRTRAIMELDSVSWTFNPFRMTQLATVSKRSAFLVSLAIKVLSQLLILQDIYPEDDNMPGGGSVDFVGSWSSYALFKSGHILVNTMERGAFVVKFQAGHPK